MSNKRNLIIYNEINKDLLNLYIKDIKKIKLLTREEEYEICEKIKNGDETALKTLIEANLRFVIKISKNFHSEEIPIMELISEANEGLIKAAHRFDHTKGNKFITYAVWWIKQSIYNFLSEHSRFIRLPYNVILKLNQLKKEITNDNYDDLISKYPQTLSLESLVSTNNPETDGRGYENLKIMESNNLLEYQETIEIDNKIRNEIFKIITTSLDEREADIIINYFNLNYDEEKMNLDDLSKKHNISIVRIQQIKDKAIRKLRYNSENILEIIEENS
jgi:RNA polymerase primary sigma factor